MSGEKQFTAAEVAKHSSRDDLWIVIDGVVCVLFARRRRGSATLALTPRKPPHRRYDLSKFIDLHPGGASVLKTVAGQDASKDFHLLHHPRVLEKYRDRLKIGVLAGSAATVAKPAKADGGFGSNIPFAEVRQS